MAQRICISHKFPGAAGAAGPGTTFLQTTDLVNLVVCMDYLPQCHPSCPLPLTKLIPDSDLVGLLLATITADSAEINCVERNNTHLFI